MVSLWASFWYNACLNMKELFPDLPFKSQLVRSEESPKLFAFTDDESKIVRVRIWKESSAASVTSRYRIAQTLFNQLESNGIPLPRFDFVLGGYKKDPSIAVFTVTDRIEGENLWPLTTCPVLPSELDTLCANLIQYYRDRFVAGDRFLKDIRTCQFMYGLRTGENEKRLYFVDLDGDYEWGNPEFHVAVINIANMIVHAERTFGEENMGVARRRLNTFIEE